MRNKTQERIQELARERAASTIHLALVEEGIEIGKEMRAEMIAAYHGPSTGAKPMLSEVSPLTAREGEPVTINDLAANGPPRGGSSAGALGDPAFGGTSL